MATEVSQGILKQKDANHLDSFRPSGLIYSLSVRYYIPQMRFQCNQYITKIWGKTDLWLCTSTTIKGGLIEVLVQEQNFVLSLELRHESFRPVYNRMFFYQSFNLQRPLKVSVTVSFILSLCSLSTDGPFSMFQIPLAFPCGVPFLVFGIPALFYLMLGMFSVVEFLLSALMYIFRRKKFYNL